MKKRSIKIVQSAISAEPPETDPPDSWSQVLNHHHVFFLQVFVLLQEQNAGV
jgi:hypothetical protein